MSVPAAAGGGSGESAHMPQGMAGVEQALAEAVRRHPVRARAINLIAVGGDGRALAAEVARRHPARVLALDLRPSDGEGLDYEVEVEGRLEWVRLRAGGRLAAHPAALAVPLLVPDLPVFLWWPGDWPPDAGLCDAADRLVVDSNAFNDLRSGLRGLAGRAADGAAGCAAGDMNWTRLLPWRRRIARWFDPPERRRRLERARFAYAVCPAQAWLLGGWLRARLGRPIDVTFEEVESRGRSPGLVEVHAGGLRLAGLTAAEASVQATGSLLASECDVRRDAIYEEALREAALAGAATTVR